jgi:DNA polymerase III subunit beta
MQFSVDRDELFTRLNALLPFAGRPNLIPVLASAHIVADGDHVRITASDLESSLVVEAEASVTKPGATCIPLDRLRNYVANLNGASVNFVLNGHGRIAATSGKDKAQLAVLAAESYADLPEVTDGPPVTIPVKELAAALRYGLIATERPDSDAMRHVGAIHLQAEDGRLLLLATQGHKFSLCDLGPLSVPWPNVAIRRDTAAKIVRLLSGIKTEVSGVSLRHDDNNLFLETEAGAITVRQMSGVNFPDWKRSVAKKFKTECTVASDELKRIVSSAAVASDPTESGVVLKFDRESITASLGSQAGEIHAHAECSMAGDPVEFRMNRAYILSILGELGEMAKVEVSDARSAVRFTTQGVDALQHLIAPMRV